LFCEFDYRDSIDWRDFDQVTVAFSYTEPAIWMTMASLFDGERYELRIFFTSDKLTRHSPFMRVFNKMRNHYVRSGRKLVISRYF